MGIGARGVYCGEGGDDLLNCGEYAAHLTLFVAMIAAKMDKLGGRTVDTTKHAT